MDRAEPGTQFWLKVITELRNRGLMDVFVVCCDDLKGFSKAIEAVFPRTVVQMPRFGWAAGPSY